MPKTIQIRDLDDETYSVLAQRAAREGLTVPELIRQELRRIAALPAALVWLEQLRRPVVNSDVDVISALDEIRGQWPDAHH